MSSRKPPTWVYNRITATGGKLGARYEASMYGPINSFLSSYFPAHQNFMVKPQPKLRPEFVPDGSDPGARISHDSYRASVIPRAFPGLEEGLLSPDFIVIKATSEKDNDELLLVVEIKPKDRSLQNAEEQLVDYMESVANKVRVDTNEPICKGEVKGMLVVGDKVTLLALPIGGKVGRTGPQTFRHVAVDALLESIAKNNL
jgi:hypothetical protein